VKQLLAQAEARRGRGPAYGNQRGDELPAEFAATETRLAKIKQAKKVSNTGAGKAVAEGKSAERPRKPAADKTIQFHGSGIAHHERR